jgi:hypothetical protein
MATVSKTTCEACPGRRNAVRIDGDDADSARKRNGAPMNDDKVKQSTETEANDHAMSRRRVVGGLAAGLVAVPAVLAEGQAAAANGPSNAAQNAMQDPTKLYPQPPFPSQNQPPPGLQSRMTPRPDCGEKSYRVGSSVTPSLHSAVSTSWSTSRAVSNRMQRLPTCRTKISTQPSRPTCMRCFGSSKPRCRTFVLARRSLTRRPWRHIRPTRICSIAPTKAAIVAFTKGLAKQVAKLGIRVNAIAPGPFWTVLQVTGGQPPEAIPQFGANTPYGRPGQPVELAPLYVMLASPESSYASGQVLGESAGRGVP